MKKLTKFVEGCESCEKAKKKSKCLWVLIWPDGGFLSRNLGIPAAFYSKKEALRFKFNSTYETPRLVKFKEPPT